MYDPTSRLRLSPTTRDGLNAFAAVLVVLALYVIAYAFGG